jgi:hypothetical protein
MPLLLERKGELIACDRRATEEAPDEKGTLTLRWRVDSEGHAQGVSVVEPEKRHTKFAVFAIDLISSLTYPPGSPIATVGFPIVFGRRPPQEPDAVIDHFECH